MSNPYAAPNSDIVNETGSSDIHCFTRFSAWGVFGLSIVTLGVYPFYWMVTRSKIINNNVKQPISAALINVNIAIYIVNFVLSIVAEAIGPQMVMLSGLISIVYLVIYLIWLFKMRDKIEEIMGRRGALSGIMTFFFNALYFQYKINEAIDNSEA